ncbi:asparagine synthetase domain-containing protein CG17486 [Scaptodrosophila lebanonensis]|uniref:Asparagine synthetase domain-containing protein CG17486 n=1 Tax=Drosophila lebanonensis TaxID=7225 RepID=A0A6J2TQ59_DROLE|nr:asparagine synthetase domain-containing protein CG17486 [Scaptodrosophila lebanonensis]
MCGIFCAVGNDNLECRLHRELQLLLQSRGPNAHEKLQLDSVLLAGYVLWQQGSCGPQKQPIVLGNWAVLFNGDFYNVDEKSTSISDSAWLAEKVAQCKGDDELLSLLQQLEGPYCLLMYNRDERVLYFGRDALGRNSLIIERQPNGLNLLSTSCYLNPEVVSLELPPLGLYKLHVDNISQCILYPWQTLNEGALKQLQNLEEAMHWKICLQSKLIAPKWLLSTVAIEAFDFYKHCTDVFNDQLYANLLNLPAVSQTLDRFDALLRRSVAARVTFTAPLCRDCLETQELIGTQCSHAKISVLYSGGIDCSILALLANEFVPAGEPIELINVAFESVAAAREDWNVPDRQTAHLSFIELKRLCPKRSWNLLEVNVKRTELQQKLATRINQLIYPLQTVLDESIGCAFWFAANAVESTARVALLGSGADELFGGYIRHRNAYRRCLADVNDEQKRQEAVLQELELDWQRISARNLARDDRIIADSGKTARAPFIEEHLVQFVRSLQPQQRSCFRLPEGVGDKLFLRLYGYRLGLRDAVLLKKRAIQFGSRIADKKQQAQQHSQYLRFGR